MKELEPNWRHAIAIWRLITWRSWIGALVIGAIFGGITGGVLAAAGYSFEENETYFSIAGALLGLAWSLGVLRMALDKKYRGFRIALIADDATPAHFKGSDDAGV